MANKYLSLQTGNGTGAPERPGNGPGNFPAATVEQATNVVCLPDGRRIVNQVAFSTNGTGLKNGPGS
jgi:hypothetical protein